jgi:HPt (histidine-containing phosphotransfer) domain-containing protein
MKGDRERFLGEGMDEYLPKPVNIDDLWESLRLYARAPEGEDPDRDAQVIDHAYLRETYRGKEDLLRRLVGEFANETVRMRHALSEAREKGGIEEAARLAHGIGSQAGTLGLPRLRSRALEAERTIKESDRDEADRAVARLEEAVSEGLDALRRETGVSN